MKKAIAIIAAVIFVFAITSLSFAVEEKEAAPTEKPKIKQVTGDVKAVDTKTGTITVSKMVKDKAELTVVTVDADTKIKMVKENKALADVKVGDKVKIKYTEEAGKNVAKSIAIKPAEEK